MTRTFRIGTRGSQLAMAQSGWVQARLRERLPEVHCELVSIKTSGDRFVDRPLSTLGGKGLFVKEIEEALSNHSVDCAVHSMKDVPAELAPGLVIAAVPAREDPRDVLIARDGAALAQLSQGARLGTSSLRRTALVRALRNDLEVVALRGNVDSRLRKLDAGELDAIVLAAAGLHRLGITRSDARYFEPRQFIPAIGQGALAIECRDDETVALLTGLDDGNTHTAVVAERAFLRRAGGSCRTPLAAYAVVDEALTLHALIADPSGTCVIRGERSGAAADAERMGRELAEELLARGGADILRALEGL